MLGRIRNLLPGLLFVVVVVIVFFIALTLILGSNGFTTRVTLIFAAMYAFIHAIIINPQLSKLISWLQPKLSNLQTKYLSGKWLNILSSNVTHYSILYHSNTTDLARKEMIETALQEYYRCNIDLFPWDHTNSLRRAIRRGESAKCCVVILSHDFQREIDTRARDRGIEPSEYDQRLRQLAYCQDEDETNSKAVLVLDSQTANSGKYTGPNVNDFVYPAGNTDIKEIIRAYIPDVGCDRKAQQQAGGNGNVAGTQQTPTQVPSQQQPLANTAPVLKIFLGVPEKNQLFIDRDDRDPEGQPYLKLGKLEVKFRDRQDNTNIRILWGMIGSGKTQIALEFAHKYQYNQQTDYLYPCVLWINASSTHPYNGFEAGLKELNKKLLSADHPLNKNKKLQNKINKQTDEYEKLRLWLDEYEKPEYLHEGKRWLLVIDRCDKEEFDKPHEFFEKRQRGDILFTMYQNPGNYAGKIEVKGMTGEDGMLLLEETAHAVAQRDDNPPQANVRNKRLQAYKEFIESFRPRVPYPRNASEEEIRLSTFLQIVRISDGNPLAIDMAGGYIATNDAREYLQEYKGFKRSQNKSFIGGSPGLPVALAWGVIFKKLSEDQSHAHQLLIFCVYLELGIIPNRIIDHMPDSSTYPSITYPFIDDKSKKDYAIYFLRDLSVIEWDEKLLHGKLRRIPRLLKLFDSTAEDQIAQIKRCVIHAVSVSLLSVSLQGNSPEQNKEMSFFLPHVRKCVEYIGELLPFDITDDNLPQRVAALDDRVKIDCVRLLYTAGLYLFEHPQSVFSGEADKLLEHAWKIREHVNDTTHDYPAKVDCSRALAKLYYERSGHCDKAKLGIARDKYRHARDDCGNLAPLMAAQTSNSLGLVYADLWEGEGASANESFKKALGICEQILSNAQGEEKLKLHMFKAEILRNMAVIAIRNVDLNKQDQNRSNRHHAKKLSVEAGNLLDRAIEELEKAKDGLRGEQDEETRKAYKEIKKAHTQCRLLDITLSLCWPPHKHGSTYGEKIEQYQVAIQQDQNAIGELNRTGQKVPADLYIQLITRLNTLAELYRRQERAPFPNALSQYKEAVNQYYNYHQRYVAPSRDLHPVGGVILKNVKQLTNWRFDNKEDETFFNEFKESYSFSDSFLRNGDILRT